MRTGWVADKLVARLEPSLSRFRQERRRGVVVEVNHYLVAAIEDKTLAQARVRNRGLSRFISNVNLICFGVSDSHRTCIHIGTSPPNIFLFESFFAFVGTGMDVVKTNT